MGAASRGAVGRGRGALCCATAPGAALLLVVTLGGCAGAMVRPPPETPVLAGGFEPAILPAAGDLRPDVAGALPARSLAEGGTSADRRRAATVARLAGGLVGMRRVQVGGHVGRADCSGLVEALYAEVGVDLMDLAPPRPGENATSRIHRGLAARGGLHSGPPRPGDLAFFNDTYDRDGDGGRDDRLTHVAVVETVEPDGTVVLVHHAGGRIRRGRMNLRHPDVHRAEDGRVLNDFLRRGGGERLAGRLFAGYGAVTTPVPAGPEGRTAASAAP